jgi:hypothetical protein
MISAIMVGTLVGNAYVDSNVGYPGVLRVVGFVLMMVGILAVIPPAEVFWGLQKIGLAWELRGRESFIQLNPGFWIYCFGFYAIVIYLVRRFRHEQCASTTR